MNLETLTPMHLLCNQYFIECMKILGLDMTLNGDKFYTKIVLEIDFEKNEITLNTKFLPSRLIPNQPNA